jgi:molybdenum cofactor cytidylyltransferase
LTVPASSKQTVLANDLADVGAVILAAGGSTRMGTPKQLLRFRGETFLRRAASVALEAGCRPVIVVTGAQSAACRVTLLGLDVLEAENQQWESGMSSSVRVGTKAMIAVSPKTAAIILMLCDQPFVTQDIIVGLVRAHRETSCSIVASRYGSSYGVPALFGTAHFAELAALQGATGAKQIVQTHLAKVHLLPFPGGEIDVDTPDDFAQLQAMNYAQ